MCAHALVSGGQGYTRSNICFEICKKSLRLPAAHRKVKYMERRAAAERKCVYTGGENDGKVK